MGETKAFINHKGGVGKSTSSLNTAAAYAITLGKKTLLIDCDGQKNSSGRLIQIKDIKKSLYDLWIDPNLPVSDVIYKTSIPNLFLIPGDARLGNLTDGSFDLEQENVMFAQLILKDRIKNLKKIFYKIFIDSQPSLNFVARSTLIASDTYVIPTDMDPDSTIGIKAIKRAVDIINKSQKNKIKHGKILICNYHKGNTKTVKSLVSKLEEEFGNDLLETKIPSDIAVKKASLKRIPLYLMSPKNPVSKAYLNIANQMEGI